MGYDIHITRRENWFDDDLVNAISIDEWRNIVYNDPEMRMDNYAEATTTEGAVIRVEEEGLSVWTKYSGDGIHGNHAWFDYRKGNIVVKNPDDEIIAKMIEIAVKLNAVVQGDEGEIYFRDVGGKPRFRLRDSTAEPAKKKWWRIW